MPPIAYCKQCGTELRDGARFCRVCGAANTPPEPAPQISTAPGTKFCGSCGQANPPDSRFCLECGAKLDAAPGPAGAAPPPQPPEPQQQPARPQTVQQQQPQNPRTNRGLLVLGGVVVCLIVIGVVAVALLIHSSHKKTLASGTSTTASTTTSSTSTTAQQSAAQIAALNTAAGRSQFNSAAEAQLHMRVKTYETPLYLVTIPTATKERENYNSTYVTGRYWTSVNSSKLYALQIETETPMQGDGLSQVISQDMQVHPNGYRLVSAGHVSLPDHPAVYRWIFTLGDAKSGTTFEQLFFQQCGHIFIVTDDTATKNLATNGPVFDLFMNSLQAKCK